MALGVTAISVLLTIDMPLFSKARPRVTSKGTFMPQEYQKKRQQMQWQIKRQYKGEPFEGPLKLDVSLFGEGRGDVDNIVGALMDAANGLLWVDDRVSVISEMHVTWKKAPRDQSKWVVIITSIAKGTRL